MKNLIFFTLLGLLAFTAIMFYNTYRHEQAHVRIFEEYDIKSHIVMYSPFDGVTIPDSNYSHLTRAEIRSMNALHALNEVFGYQIDSIIVGIFVFYFLLLLCIDFYIGGVLSGRIAEKA